MPLEFYHVVELCLDLDGLSDKLHILKCTNLYTNSVEVLEGVFKGCSCVPWCQPWFSWIGSSLLIASLFGYKCGGLDQGGFFFELVMSADFLDASGAENQIDILAWSALFGWVDRNGHGLAYSCRQFLKLFRENLEYLASKYGRCGKYAAQWLSFSHRQHP